VGVSAVRFIQKWPTIEPVRRLATLGTFELARFLGWHRLSLKQNRLATLVRYVEVSTSNPVRAWYGLITVIKSHGRPCRWLAVAGGTRCHGIFDLRKNHPVWPDRPTTGRFLRTSVQISSTTSRPLGIPAATCH
jgi:hypothetical protein